MYHQKINNGEQPILGILRIFANIIITLIGTTSAITAYIFLNAATENPNVTAKIIAGGFCIIFAIFALTFFSKLISKNLE